MIPNQAVSAAVEFQDTFAENFSKNRLNFLQKNALGDVSEGFF